MYAIIQTRYKPDDYLSENHGFGIATTTKGYTNLSGPIDSIKFADLAKPLKQLMRSEFQDVNVGFYLVLE